MDRIDDVIYELRQIARDVRYDKSLKKYAWVLEELERLINDIEAQKDTEESFDY